MISEVFIILRQNTLLQTGSGVFWLSLLFLLLLFKKREWKYKFVYPVYAMVFTFIWYPTYAYLINPVLNDYGHRMVNVIPVVAVIAIVISFCCSRLHGKEVILAVIGVAFLLYYSADSGYDGYYLEDFYVVENIYGLPQDVVDVCDLLLSEDEEPFIITTDGDMVYFRQYSSKIKMLYGNNVYGTMRDEIDIPSEYLDMAALMENTEFISLNVVGEKASRYNVEYIVVNISTHAEPYNEGETYYTLYATIGDYAVYKNNSLY
ncbi:MAG: hypothetical protein LUH58_06335 [Lachnospiraceae bacterium]|nr:hypothetical protein [Lachnospiraceae bacterium]